MPKPHTAGSVVKGCRSKSSDARGGRRDNNTFRQLIEQVRPAVDARLVQLLEPLCKQASSYDIRYLLSELQDLVARGGKRFRAGLAVVAYAGVRPRSSLEPAIDAGAALELLHAYLLVQDDWMDGDRSRRGGPSVHTALGRQLGSRALGDASAILSSDLAWGLAVQTLSAISVPPRHVVRALAAFCEAHRDVVFGQQLDLVGNDGSVEEKHALKTASYTTRGPLLVGASLAGASPKTLLALERFAHPLGVAFQLRDDLLGIFAPTAQTGKPLGGDLREGKHTAVTVAGERRLDSAGRKAYHRVFGKRRARKADLVLAAEHLERCGARQQVQRRVKTLCRRAARRATELPLHQRARRQLLDAVALVARDVPFSPSTGKSSTVKARAASR